MSFYYWRTHFFLDSLEKQTLINNHVQQLYTRYFDIDFSPADAAPLPVAIVSFDGTTVPAAIIPVVYIKNRVFEKIDAAGSRHLSEKVFKLVSGINLSAHLSTAEIQFDCDWTEGTRSNYFIFLQEYKFISKQLVSATIRLHQVKYPGKTGIPPVDYGSLMYYNMGTISAGDEQSIYDKKIAEKYNPSIHSYPLSLNIALPIFAWGLQVRDGKVIKLLNKMNSLHFDNDTNFSRANQGRYLVQNACFHSGFYFKQGDVIKTEHVSPGDLKDIITQVNRYSNHTIRNIVFYDIDKENLALYDENVFQEILDHLN